MLIVLLTMLISVQVLELIVLFEKQYPYPPVLEAVLF
jgi:hypothetical protein